MCVVCCLGSPATCPVSTFGDACGKFSQFRSAFGGGIGVRCAFVSGAAPVEFIRPC